MTIYYTILDENASLHQQKILNNFLNSKLIKIIMHKTIEYLKKKKKLVKKFF